MPYDEDAKNSTLKYKKEKIKPVQISYRKEEYDNEILPAIQKSGLPVATFIRQAVKEKIERDHLS